MKIDCFKAEVTAGMQTAKVKFLVIEKDTEPLLSWEASKILGVLKTGVGLVNEPDGKVHASKAVDIFEEYTTVFSGVGKMKNRQISLTVNPDVPPIAQPGRHTAFGIRKRVEAKMKELLEQDIIEPVDGHTPWISPVVNVAKPNGEIGLCIDMRRANEAIVQERHPIPTFEESLQDMSQSRVFSKLDLKWGYHQMELHPDSRDITTFVVHCGLELIAGAYPGGGAEGGLGPPPPPKLTPAGLN